MTSVFADEPTEDERALGVVNNPAHTGSLTDRLAAWVEQARGAGRTREQVDTDLRAWLGDVKTRHGGSTPQEAVSAFLAATQRNEDLLDAIDLVTPPALPTTSRPAERVKALKDRLFLMTITPNTGVADIAEDIAARLGWTEGMRLLAIWTSLAQPRVVGAIVRYEARGANANDLRKQIMRACPVGAEQVTVTDIITINRDVDPALVDACLLELDDEEGCD